MRSSSQCINNKTGKRGNNKTMNSTTTKNKIYFMTTYAIITALICIFAPMSVPIGPIPISLTNLILYFAIYLLGTKGTAVSYVVYLLLGIVGLPIFSGYEGGPAKLVGPTGGYLIGFFFIIFVAGITFEKVQGKWRIPLTILGMIIGTAIAYTFGTIWFIYQAKCDLAYALTICVVPFVPFDLAKIAVATILGVAVRVPLLKQGLLPSYEN